MTYRQIGIIPNVLSGLALYPSKQFFLFAGQQYGALSY
jgi:hypothetical protein